MTRMRPRFRTDWGQGRGHSGVRSTCSSASRDQFEVLSPAQPVNLKVGIEAEDTAVAAGSSTVVRSM